MSYVEMCWSAYARADGGNWKGSVRGTYMFRLNRYQTFKTCKLGDAYALAQKELCEIDRQTTDADMISGSAPAVHEYFS